MAVIPVYVAAEYLVGALLTWIVAKEVSRNSAAIADGLENAAAKAKEKLKELAPAEPCKDCPCARTVVISKAMSPQAAQHILEAQAAGHPRTLTYSKVGALARGRAATGPYPTKPGFDRDEYPPKTFLEGGLGASVRYIPVRDNRSAGGQMASQLAGATEGCKVTMTVGP